MLLDQLDSTHILCLLRSGVESIYSNDSLTRVGRFVEEARGIIRVNHCRTREDAFARVGWSNGWQVILPSVRLESIRGSGAPMLIARYQLRWVVLIVHVDRLFPLLILGDDEAVGVVHESTRRAEVDLRSIGLVVGYV